VSSWITGEFAVQQRVEILIDLSQQEQEMLKFTTAVKQLPQYRAHLVLGFILHGSDVRALQITRTGQAPLIPLSGYARNGHINHA
jgi:hypothetical protein